jgi:cyclopropane fatty-acyl-phospholipid synthase-like methyltransferase
VYYFIIYQNKIFWESLYDVMLYLYPSTLWKNVNYGYAALTEDGKTIELKEADEPERFSLQLYHLTVTGMNMFKSFEGKVICEVSSGRGGGLQYIADYLKPAKIIGVDISTAQV